MLKPGVVIVTYNNSGLLKRLSSELVNQTFKPNEIVVIDNASGNMTKGVGDGLRGNLGRNKDSLL